MNILIVGNGFDLAHGLPTKYSDFLKFLDKFRIAAQVSYHGTVEQFENYHFKDWCINDEVKEYIKTAFNKETRTSIMNELKKCIDDNYWINYFKENQNYIKDNWIDFESEISRVIKEVEENFCNIRQGKENERFSKRIENPLKNSIHLNGEIIHYLGSIAKGESEEKLRYNLEKSFETFKKKLKNDLLRLIRSFEIYLCDCLSKIEIKEKSSDIETLHINKILSFNYTSTYKKLYNTSFNDNDCDFIHGQALISNSIETNNMVLGIDDYHKGDDINQKTEFIYFKKYYQRIVKSTDNQYLKWIQDTHYNNRSYFQDNIYIFGHSLDVTDKDVLRSLIKNENVKTTIFYKDQDMLEQQVANLVKLIDRDDLLKYTSGKEKRIEFKKQADFIKI